MIYLQKEPSARLRPWVQSLWYCRAPGRAHGRERVLPDGRLQIILNLSREYLTDCGEEGSASERFPRAILIGLRDRFQIIDSADMEETAVVVIRPGGFPGLFSERADILFQRVVPLENVWHEPRLFECLAEAPTPIQKLACLDNFLVRLTRNKTRRSEITDHAL